eukprot:TRINITY_DN2208_c0_g1_i23.p1 TRINITY_DN2208_c0_g1~~TRINITY_DN2208_c0_g1_i23.p1  ORF type:complete len:288 (-),score=87.37 TRINITY_DN2208_c0_g1_i23:133-996(-)
MDNGSEFTKKASHTDVASAGRQSLSKNFKLTEKPKASFLNAQLETSKDSLACPSHKDILGSESFSFEKEKIQQLRIESIPPMDVNDESIAKLKTEILKQFQNILNRFERVSKIARILTVALLFIEILEMIGMFFMLLYLSLRMVPTEQILFWVGISLGLSLAQMFLLIKGIVAFQSKDSKAHKEHLYSVLIFFLVLVVTLVVYIKAVYSDDELFGEPLEADAKATLKFAQAFMLVQAAVKTLCQLVFFVIEWVQIRHLKMMDKNRTPSIDPPSQNYILGNQAMERIS